MSFTAITAPNSFYDSASGGNGAGRSFVGDISSIQAGDIIIWKVSYGGATTTLSISDGTGTVWAQTSEIGDANQRQTWLYTVASVATGSPTYTITHGAARAERRYQFWHYRPSAAASFGDWAGANGSTSSPSSGNLAVTGSDILAIGGVDHWNNLTASSPLINGSSPDVSLLVNAHVSHSFVKAFGSGYTGAASLTLSGADDWVASQIYFTIGAAATRDQEGFRFGVDDGNEASHGWEAVQDAGVTLALSSVRLLRLLIDATGDPASTAYTLRYQKNGAGGYQAVNVGSTQAVTLDLAVTAGADDAQQVGTTMTVTGTTIGASLDATTEWVGIRFQNVTVPQGATITAAYLSVVPSGTGEDEPLVTIFCQDADNGAAFTTTASDITNRTLTASSVSWSSTDLGATGSSYHNTPSLVTPVQAVINRAGWASGNALVFIIQGGATSTRDLTIESFENAGANPPLLHIEYSVPAEVYVTTSSNITAGGEATTARLTPPSGKTTSSFTTGRRWDDENGADSIDIAADFYTEVEWALTVVSPAADGDYFDFRVYAGSSPLNSYTLTPRWTIGTPIVATQGQIPPAGPGIGPDYLKMFRAAQRAIRLNTDVTAALTGASLTSSSGSIGPQTSAALLGQALSGAHGSVSPTLSVPQAGQALSSAAGSLAPALSKALSGSGLSGAAGTLAPGSSVALTGSLLSFGQGSVSSGGDVVLALTGQALTMASGTLLPALSVGLTGQAASISVSSATPALSKAVSGSALSIASGAVSPAVVAALSGGLLTIGQGTVQTPGGITLALTGQAITTAQGSLAPSISNALTGSDLSVAVGGVVFSPYAALTGSALATSLGSLAATSTVSLSGSLVSMTLGTVVSSGAGAVAEVRFKYAANIEPSTFSARVDSAYFTVHPAPKRTQ